MNRNWLIGVATVVLAFLLSQWRISVQTLRNTIIQIGVLVGGQVIVQPFPLFPFRWDTTTPTHARYLGELKGSWYDIGKQYGEKAGDLMVMVFDGWYGARWCEWPK